MSRLLSLPRRLVVLVLVVLG
ncbi:MAG: hypothetical protein JWQ65_1212, partial [Devosia sp.]|nr:hypothetical protein [Devosia sp.]